MEIQALRPGDSLWSDVADFAEKCPWSAGKLLAKRMRKNDFGEQERVFVALDETNIAGFCTLSETDCLPDVDFSPYVGFVFVAQRYRGRRLSRDLIDAASDLAREQGHETLYLVSDHVGLYEKYGFTAIDHRPAPWDVSVTETVFARDTARPEAAPKGSPVKSMLPFLFYLLLIIGGWTLLGHIVFPG